MRPASAQSTNLRKPIIISAIVHLVLFSSFFVVPTLRIPTSEKPINVTWVELPRGTSEEVNIGMKKSEALPQSTIEEQKKLAELETPKQTPLPPTKPEEAKKAVEDKKTELPNRPKMNIEDKTAKVRKAEKPPASKQDKAIQNALAKIDKQLKDRTVAPEAAQIKENGEGYKYGTSNKPLRVMPSDPEYLKYQALVRHKIMQEWVVPMALTEGTQMSAKIEVMINVDGEVVSAHWASQSGNPGFDQSALRAVKRASPFPKPPDRLAWEAYNEGFLIQFDTRMKAQY